LREAVFLVSWHERAIIYHLFPLALYTPENPSGCAESLLDWVDRIKALGCNTVLLGPVFESSSHGYDVTDYSKIDHRIGSNAEFETFAKKCHESSLRLVLDGVFNHCGRECFIFRDIFQNRENSIYRDWISGVDFQGSTGGAPFAYDTWNNFPELPKLNLKNADVREYLLRQARTWIEMFDFDGLRLDAADVLDFSFMRELGESLRKIKPDFFLVGEVVHGDYRMWFNDANLDSVTNYTLYKGLYSSHNTENLFELEYTLKQQFASGGTLEDRHLLTFLDNHDQNRIASVVSKPEYLRTLYILLFTVPGIPCLYYGSEWELKGEKQNGSDSPLRPYLSLNSLPVPPLGEFLNRLATIRVKSDALCVGTYRTLNLSYQSPLLFERQTNSETVLVAINPFETEKQFRLPAGRYLEKICETQLQSDDEFIGIPAYTGWILQML
jgi:glycosidase